MRNTLLFLLLAFSTTANSQIPCNSWLQTPTAPAYVEVGDLDVPGTQLTVEAMFNRTTPFTGGDLYAGNLVSKHNHPSTVNYLLRPNSAEITTSNGYFIAQAPCGIELNKNYHVAMVYNGATLKFYRNGFLMAQVNATGTLYQNDLRTRIGWLDFTPLNENFIGYINEVRIWNTARSQAQIQATRQSPLLNPTTQAGLLAYYRFDNLLNKQGNAAWNATLAGSASFSASNPQCSVTTDSCNVTTPDSIIVNHYTPAISLDICTNKLTVESATDFGVGDTVLLIQMKGAAIDSTNTPAFGSVINTGNAGNYEFNYVKSIAGNIIELKNKLTRGYDLPSGKVQLIRVPYYHSKVFDKVLTCLPWDGSKGGVLVLNVRDTLTLLADISTSGKGFRGGKDPFSNPGSSVYNCYENQFFYPVLPDLASEKGEGISLISAAKSYGKGAPANGGGGGNSHNSGGGGGSNAAAGGFGGYSFEGSPCNGTVPFNNRGIGGYPLNYNNALNKIFLGGGGGAGHSNNPEAFEALGGNGGGIIILTADKLMPNAQKIIANGHDGKACGTTGGGCHEGMGGGGGAGAILLNINSYISSTVIEVKGGRGADMTSVGNLRLGPGGGGGGGIVWYKQTTQPAPITVSNLGGASGICTGYSNAWGATPGNNGSTLNNLNLPIDAIQFVKNIDSVRFNFASTSCAAFNFIGLGYTNTNPIASWNWYFGDGGQATTQNTSHTYASSGTFNVKLVITDINGCKDSITRQIITNTVTAFAGSDASYCTSSPVTHQLQGTPVAGASYSWQPSGLLNNANISNPIATVSNTTRFYFTVTLPGGCSGIDSVDVLVNPVPVISSIGDTSLCANGNLVLNANGGSTYSWSPATAVSNPNIANPVFVGTNNQILTVTGTNTAGCSASATFSVVVKPLPVVNTINDSSFCYTNLVTLNTTGAQTYTWLPATNLSNASIGNPVFSGNTPITYIVTGTGTNGCSNKDTVTLNPVTTQYPALAGSDANYCSASVITHQLNASTTGGTGFSWSPATGLNNPNISNPIATINDTTRFYVTVTGPQFCAGTDSVDVFVHPLPNITSTGDTAICANGNLLLNATGATTYSWSPATVVSNPNIANPVFVGTTDQTLTVTGTSNAGCSATNTFMVTVKTLPIVQTITDTTICSTQSITLNTTGAQTYSWLPPTGLSDPNSNNPVFGGTVGDIFIVTGIGANGCAGNDTVEITVQAPGIFNQPPDAQVCLLESVTLNGNNGDNVSYQWSPAATLNNAGIINPIATPTVAGNNVYTVTISEAICNSSNNYIVNLMVNDLPEIDASRSNDLDCSIRTAVLSATGGIQYVWSPASTLTNANIPNPTASPTADTKYTVIGTDANGCRNKDSVMVLVKGTNGRFDVPNSFTPNGDGLNDCFGVKHWGDAVNFKMMIFNRYGEKVFETTNINNCWDGRYKGQPANIGGYVYYITSKNLCGEMIKKGNVLLIH